MGLNAVIFKVINGQAYHNFILDKVMMVMSEYVPYIFMIALAAIYIMGLAKKDSRMRGVTVDAFMVTAISLFIGYVIGAIWYVPRPFVNSKVNLLLPHMVDASFPSDHAMGTMSISVGLNKYSKVYGVLLGALSLLVGISRVFVGHHYPTDVLGGYAIVFITSFAYDRLLKNRVQAIYMKVEGLLVKRLPVLGQFL